jgi:membrane-associated phospholipid phosphatase
MHVFGTVAPTAALLMNKEAGKKLWVWITALIICIGICLSTVFMKQHSVIDLVTGGLLYLPIYLLIYRGGRNWRLWQWPLEPLKAK